jgi:D-amino-acid oxidase
MLDEIKANDYTDHVDVETDKYYTNIEELVIEAKARGCDGLVNCTGLGSKLLCDDASLIGARGILLHYDRASCVWYEKARESISSDEDQAKTVQDSVIGINGPPFGSETMPCYMIPRGDIIAVGGSYLEGDEETGIRALERERLLENAQNMGIDTKKSMCVSEWVGFRPYRPTARLEVDEQLSSLSGVTVVHSYGYGGSGWTVFVGVASDNVNLLQTWRKRVVPS